MDEYDNNTELYQSVLKYSLLVDGKRVPLKTGSVTGCFMLYHFFGWSKRFSIYST